MKRIIIFVATPLLLVACHTALNQSTTIELGECIITAKRAVRAPMDVHTAIIVYSEVYGVPAELVKAQLRLESNYFKSSCGRNKNNGFGHRLYSKKNKAFYYIYYKNQIECIESHCKLLSSKYWPSYTNSKERVLNPSLEDWIKALDKQNVTGRTYAGDKQYKKKLRDIIGV